MPKVVVSVQNMWNQFSNATMSGVPKDSVQYQQSEKIFYCGVASCIFELIDNVSNDKYSDEEGADALQEMLNEIHHFLK